MHKKKKKVSDTTLDKFDLANAASPSDCTGLIMTPPTDDSEWESYKEIYNFGPPEIHRDPPNPRQ